MPVTSIDKTVGGADSNSYVDVAFIEQYSEDSFDTGDWDALSADDKTRIALMATRIIDSMSFLGQKADTTPEGHAGYQALEFPRSTNVDSDGDKFIPISVQRAQAAQALYMAEFYKDLKKRQSIHAQGVEEFEVGDFMEKITTRPDEIAPEARRLLAEDCLLENAAGPSIKYGAKGIGRG